MRAASPRSVDGTRRRRESRRAVALPRRRSLTGGASAHASPRRRSLTGGASAAAPPCRWSLTGRASAAAPPRRRSLTGGASAAPRPCLDVEVKVLTPPLGVVHLLVGWGGEGVGTEWLRAGVRGLLGVGGDAGGVGRERVVTCRRARRSSVGSRRRPQRPSIRPRTAPLGPEETPADAFPTRRRTTREDIVAIRQMTPDPARASVQLSATDDRHSDQRPPDHPAPALGHSAPTPSPLTTTPARGDRLRPNPAARRVLRAAAASRGRRDRHPTPPDQV